MNEGKERCMTTIVDDHVKCIHIYSAYRQVGSPNRAEQGCDTRGQFGNMKLSASKCTLKIDTRVEY
jgi:hypothetical protein